LRAPLASLGDESFSQFFEKLLSVDFMPHAHCFFGRSSVLWLHAVSDVLIFGAYFAIPFVLLYFARRRKDLPFTPVFYLFGAFIFCCGLTHLLSLITLWYPVYRLEGVAKAVTAIVSLATTLFLFPLVPKALSLRSPRELEAKNEELVEAYREIREAEKAKSEFFANVSHELRTPLTLILSPLESLMSGEFGQLSDAQLRVARAMHTNAIRLLQMVNSTLDFSKVESGRFEIKRQPTNVVQISQAMFAEFLGGMRQKNIVGRLTTDLSDKVLSIDRYLYERIFFNLLSNALKFTPPGGTITVRLAFSEATERFALSVADSGVGIAEPDRARLFERFSQLDQSPSRRAEGTGLGLAMVKEFAQLLGGNVRVESQVGKGSVFFVDFVAPVATADSKVEATDLKLGPFLILPAVETFPSRTGEYTPASNYRILVAEDNPELALYLRSLLEPLGEVALARDGEEALRLVRSWGPQLVISDVMMPKLTGLELCTQIKSSLSLSQTVVVLLTAITDRDALLKGWEAGADEYLFKPFHPKELVTRVRSLLSLIEERRKSEERRDRQEEMAHFAYIASHDLREPLRGIISFGQLLKKNYGPQLDSRADEYLGFILDGAERMIRLIEDLGVYAQVDVEPEKRVDIDIHGIVELLVEELRAQGINEGIHISLRPLAPAFGNPKLIRILFENLLSNALKFRRGRVGKIEIGCEVMGDTVVYRIKDDGIGFKPEYADRIFTLFKRLNSREQYPGSGIGLSVCRRIVERLGGRIWAESELGQGSIFSFSLPREDRPRGGREAATASPAKTERRSELVC